MTEAQFVEILRNNARHIEQLKKKTSKVILVGAGNTLSLYEKSIEAENIKISGIVDNDPKKIGMEIMGKKVSPASEIVHDYGEDCLALIVTAIDKTYHALADQMSGQVSFASIDSYIFALHTEELMECYRSFEDQESAELYAQLISWHITNSKPAMLFPCPEQYFVVPEFATMDEHEVFVDCGAYVGDTVERYLFGRLGVFGKIYAFEPDKRNFKACIYRKERLLNEWALEDDKITVLPYGVGRESGTCYIKMAEQGLNSQIAMGKADGDCEMVEIVALDDYFFEKKTKVSFIKMDIEGYEYDALRGGETMLRHCRPKLAVCIYHNATDMYRMLLYLKSLDLGYRFQCRHHTVARGETVLYAYVPEK